MRKHTVTFGDIVKSRYALAGIKDQKSLAKKTGISEKTLTRHIADGAWSREQVQQMHRYLHFTPEDMEIYFDAERR